MKKILRYTIVILIAFIGIWTLYFLWDKSREKPVEYEVVNPEKGNVVKKTMANGSVVPRREVLIKPTVSGIIREVYVEAGDQVKKGDLLAKVQVVPDMLSLSNAESRVRRAEIGVRDAKRTLDRNKPLHDKGVISDAEFQSIQNGMLNAEEELAAAQDNLSVIREGLSRNAASASNTLIRSTIDGMVLDVPVKEGNSVIERNNFNEGTTIASVANMTDLIFQGDVDESEVGKIELGMDLILTIGAIENEEFNAKLEYIAPKGVEEEGAIKFEVRAAVKLKEDQFIRAGYSANADIVLERRDSVMTIPESLVEFNEKGDSAFVEVKNGEGWDRTNIKTGLSDGINIEVLNGITMTTELKGAVKSEDEGSEHRGRRRG